MLSIIILLIAPEVSLLFVYVLPTNDVWKNGILAMLPTSSANDSSSSSHPFCALFIGRLLLNLAISSAISFFVQFMLYKTGI